MFKALVLQALHGLSDDRVEYLILDRLTFMRFLGPGLEDRVPDARTVWLYRGALTKAGAIAALFDDFDGHLKRHGYLAMGGQILDATIVPVPRNHNTGGGERGDQGGRRAACVGEPPGQTAPEGSGRALDRKAWTLILRLQEPHRH